MDLAGWDERYRTRERPAEDLDAAATPLLIETAGNLRPGKALDLACGTGRNASWLAEHGWDVTAIDGAPSAIEILRDLARVRGLAIHTKIADLQRHQFVIEGAAWDLICICYYLQRDLFEPAKQGVAPNGILLAIVHIPEPGEPPTEHRLAPGELSSYFEDWEILHSREGKPRDSAHRRAVAEIVARRPSLSAGKSSRPS